MKDSKARTSDHADELASDRWIHARVQCSARVVIRRLGEPATSLDDLTQSAWIMLLERVRGYDAERSSLRTFACRVLGWWAASQCRHLARSKRLRQRTLIAERHTTPSITPSERVENEDLLSVLTPNERAIAELAARWGVAGAAERLGMHRSTVHRRVSRIRSRLERAV
jgi:RNA polymerase sigma factor (sigma-70 family)